MPSKRRVFFLLMLMLARSVFAVAAPPDSPTQTPVVLEFGDVTAIAMLEDSETTRAFLDLLPLTLPMTRFYDREYAASLRPASLPATGEMLSDYENGDVTYYVSGNAFAVFFGKAETSSQDGLIRMGKITSDLSDLIALQGDQEVTITRADEEADGTVNADFSVYTNLTITGLDATAMDAEQLAVLGQQLRYLQAMTEADVDTLREIVAPDRVFTHMSGMQQTPEEYFADIQDGNLRYFAVDVEDPVVEVEGNLASVTYGSVLHANAYGAQGSYRFGGTHWFEKRDGAWISINNPNQEE